MMADVITLAALVAMVVLATGTAAPLAGEKAPEGEGMMDKAGATAGNSESLSVDKRAKEEILFGNRQNSARIGGAAFKKSAAPQVPAAAQEQQQQEQQEEEEPPSQQQQRQQQQQQQQVQEEELSSEHIPEQENQEEGGGGLQDSVASTGQNMGGEDSQKFVEDSVARAETSSADSANSEEEENEEGQDLLEMPGNPPSLGDGEEEPQPVSDDSSPTEQQSEESENAQQPEDNPANSEDTKEEEDEETEEEAEEEAKEQEEEEEEGEGRGVNDSPPDPIEGGVHGNEDGEEEKEGEGEVEEKEKEEEEEEEGEENLLSAQEGGRVMQQEASEGKGEPDSSNTALQTPTAAEEEEAEENEDDIENLLKELHRDNNEGSSPNQVHADAVDAHNDDDEEGNAERELLQVAQQADGAGSSAGNQYRQNLMKYILSHGEEEYGRPPNHLLYSSDPYNLQRRRRSPHPFYYPSPSSSSFHQRTQRGNEKELSRSKRTKRDLFDDNLYYNLDDASPYNNQRQQEVEEEVEEEEQEAERNAELQELVSYLMALYPAIYDKQRPNLPYAPYMWQGANYPQEEEEVEDLEDERPYWSEDPVYYKEEENKVEEPGWGQEEQEEEQEVEDERVRPAWFYPTEVEEDEGGDFYPAAATTKREMLSFVPGQRRKRYFFPFAREPYTHWGAFVPSQRKRNYGRADEEEVAMAEAVEEAKKEEEEEEEEEEKDPYRRLRELAMVLGEDRQMPAFWGDDLDEYKKK